MIPSLRTRAPGLALAASSFAPALGLAGAAVAAIGRPHEGGVALLVATVLCGTAWHLVRTAVTGGTRAKHALDADPIPTQSTKSTRTRRPRETLAHALRTEAWLRSPLETLENADERFARALGRAREARPTRTALLNRGADASRSRRPARHIHRGRRRRDQRGTLNPKGHPVTMTDPQLVSIIGSVLGVGVALAILIMRSTARVDADRRAFVAEAAADRRAFQQSMDGFRTEMRTFQTEMQRLAERQSRVEGALETTRSTAAAD